LTGVQQTNILVLVQTEDLENLIMLHKQYKELTFRTLSTCDNTLKSTLHDLQSSLTNGEFVYLNKWKKIENIEYYGQYLVWRAFLSTSSHFWMKFYDEV
jgi:hypothetical protein